MKRKLIYIAGPMAGLEDFNYPAFREAARRIWVETNYLPIDPSSIGESIAPTSKLAEDVKLATMVQDMELAALRQCDAILLLPHWECSVGARVELRHALALNLQVFTSIEEVAANE